MKQYYLDERTGISYTLQGDYYLPDLIFPAEEVTPIDVWGQRHKRNLKEHRRVIYTNLLTSGKLNAYLADIDKQAKEMFSRLVEQMAEREGVTEQIKAADQISWVRAMNNIRNRAIEIINTTIIFSD